MGSGMGNMRLSLGFREWIKCQADLLCSFVFTIVLGD